MIYQGRNDQVVLSPWDVMSFTHKPLWQSLNHQSSICFDELQCLFQLLSFTGVRVPRPQHYCSSKLVRCQTHQIALSPILPCLKHHSNNVAPHDKAQISVLALEVLYMQSNLTSKISLPLIVLAKKKKKILCLKPFKQRNKKKDLLWKSHV